MRQFGSNCIVMISEGDALLSRLKVHDLSRVALRTTSGGTAHYAQALCGKIFWHINKLG